MSITRPIGLIHCALAHGGVWRRFVEELGPGYLPILIELPGHGEAPDWDHSRDYSDQALELALDTLPAQPVPLIGHSYGAALALRLAVERPSRVSSLVLIEPVFFAAAKGSWAFDKVVRDHDPFVRKLAEGSNAMAAKAFTSVWDNETPWADIPQKQKDYLMSRIPLVKAGDTLLFDDRTDLLRAGRIEGLDMPVTIIDGGDSHPVIEKIVVAIGDRIPDVEWITVPGAGHMVPITHPGAVAGAVRNRLVWPDD